VNGLFLVVLLTFSFSASAVNPCENKISEKSPAVEMAEEILKQLKLPGWSASSKDIEKSPCKGKVPTLSELKRTNDKLLEGPIEKEKTIVGAKFENESEQMLRMFDLLVQKRKYSGEDFVLPNQKDYSHLTSGSCKKVRCALNQLFGEEYSENAMYLLSQYELNVSPIGLAGDKTMKFPLEELKSIHQSVADLPKELFPIRKAKSLRRSSMSSGNVIGNATIMIFDGVKAYDHHEKAGICTHEFAHNFSYRGNLDESPDWLNISGWIDDGGKWKRDPSTDNKFVSKYSKVNPAEDFAESIVAYRYNPDALRAASVEKYNFIKELVFKGREYTASGDNSCQGKTSFIKEVEEKLNEAFKNDSFKDDEFLFDQSIAECSREILNRFTGGSSEELQQCLSVIKQRGLLHKNWNHVKDKFKYPEKAKELVDKNFIKLKLEVSEDYLNGYTEKIDQELDEIERKSMTKIVERMNLMRKLSRASSVEEFCREDVSKYSYQQFKGLNDSLSPFFLFANREQVHEKVRKTCLSVFKDLDDLKNEVKLSDVLN